MWDDLSRGRLFAISVVFFNVYGGTVRLRDMAPIALDSAVFTVLLFWVLLFSMLANSQCEKQCRALAAKRMELVACGLAFQGQGESRLCASLEITRRHLEANARKHRLFGLTDVTPSLMLKVRALPPPFPGELLRCLRTPSVSCPNCTLSAAVHGRDSSVASVREGGACPSLHC